MKKIKSNQLKKLKSFIETSYTEVYPEPLSKLHSTITEKVLPHIVKKFNISTSARILDVGCGQGVALNLFKKLGFSPIGITLSDQDIQICKASKFKVFQMDQSFLEFEKNSFDFLWSRHCLEHSLFPLFTLGEYRRVLSSGGIAYIEVPAPETVNQHHQNKNHYSLFTREVWKSLMDRSQFKLIDSYEYTLDTSRGPDYYWSYVLKCF